MGLESINFIFRSEEQMEYSIASIIDITHKEERKYVYKEDNEYWIDIEFQNQYILSIRITLCNPRAPVLKALFRLLSILFSFREGVLFDMSTKQIYKTYDAKVQKAIEESYQKKEIVFRGIYGNYIAAIGSEEFYRSQDDALTP